MQTRYSFHQSNQFLYLVAYKVWDIWSCERWHHNHTLNERIMTQTIVRCVIDKVIWLLLKCAEYYFIMGHHNVVEYYVTRTYYIYIYNSIVCFNLILLYSFHCIISHFRVLSIDTRVVFRGTIPSAD